MKGICKLLFVIILAFLSGCNKDDEVEEKYFKTFSHVETEQFHTSYGRGGIYWLSDSEVLLNAQVDFDGKKQRGIFRVGLNGESTKLLDTYGSGGYHFCLSERNLFLNSRNSLATIVNNPEEIKIILGFIKERDPDYMYSVLDCLYVYRPAGFSSLKALREEDGIIANIKPIGSDLIRSYVVTRDGEKVSDLDLGGKVLKSQSRYSKYDSEYFYYDFFQRRGCGQFIWISSLSWQVREEEHCFDEWLESTSKIANPTRVGIFIEQHTTKYHSGSLITERGMYSIEKGSIRRSSVSPNGCLVAYGYGDYRSRKGDNDYRQVLKVFDACKFMEDRKGG